MSSLGPRLERLAGRQADARAERWYSGTVYALNTDGSYQVRIAELNTVVMRIFRAGGGPRLLPGQRVSIRAAGVDWSIA